MSTSRNKRSEGTSSPVQRYLEWKGSGFFRYYDKEAGKNVDVKTLKMIILSERSTISGWHETLDTQIRSNMVDNLSKELFTIIATKNSNNPRTVEVAKGLWKEVKKTVNNVGGKFTKCIFALTNTGEKGSWELSRVDFATSGLFSLSLFSSANDYDPSRLTKY